MFRIFLAALLIGSTASAEGEKPGPLDYYVMALSWSPNWCALQGDHKGSNQCGTITALSCTVFGRKMQRAGRLIVAPTTVHRPAP